MHHESLEVDAPDAPWAEPPMVRLRRFFEVNGYALEREQSDGDGAPVRVVLTRGKPSAGWWSSDMTDLHARADCAVDAEGAVTIVCRVDVRGQILSEDDRAFWRREVEAARDFLCAEDLAEDPIDLREQERARAEAQFSSMLSGTLRGFLVAFMVCFFVVLLLYRLGFIKI